MLDEKVIITDFFGLVENELIDVLQCLSKRESWQTYTTGYEFPEDGDGDFEDGIMIFMETSNYGEVLLSDSEFFSYLELSCNKYLQDNPQNEEKVLTLLEKIKIALNLNN